MRSIRLAELPPGPVHLDCPADFERSDWPATAGFRVAWTLGSHGRLQRSQPRRASDRHPRGSPCLSSALPRGRPRTPAPFSDALRNAAGACAGHLQSQRRRRRFVTPGSAACSRTARSNGRYRRVRSHHRHRIRSRGDSSEAVDVPPADVSLAPWDDGGRPRAVSRTARRSTTRNRSRTGRTVDAPRVGLSRVRANARTPMRRRLALVELAGRI